MDESFLALFEFLFDLLRLFLPLLLRLQVFGVFDFIGMIFSPMLLNWRLLWILLFSIHDFSLLAGDSRQRLPEECLRVA